MHRVLWIGWIAASVVLAGGCADRGTKMSGKPPEGFVRPLPESGEYVALLDKSSAYALRSGLMTLAPGANCGWHSTDEYEELIICLAGTGEVASEGGTRRSLVAPCYAYNPPHMRHCVFNTGAEALRYVYVVAPAGGRAEPHAH